MKSTSMKQTPTINRDERGFASIVVALILIVVLALMTIAFAQLARREQQNALNKQLASQAYYAAESGINDAYKAIQDWVKTDNLPTVDPNVCVGKGVNDTLELRALKNAGTLDDLHGVSYSCMLLDLEPPNIVWGDVSPESDRTASFSATGAVNSMEIVWGSADKNDTPVPSGTSFLPKADWASKNYPPLLEVSLTKMGDTFNRQDLVDNTFTFYLYPSQGSGAGNSVDFEPTKSGKIVKADNCTPRPDTNLPCSVTINNINGSANTSYLIHIINHYDQANIIIGNATAGNGGNGQQQDLTDGPIQIDVTGKARNVLKRLQVNLLLTPSADLPPGAIEGQSVCKRFGVYPGGGSYDSLDPACNLSN
jgi:hypothetical protein